MKIWRRKLMSRPVKKNLKILLSLPMLICSRRISRKRSDLFAKRKKKSKEKAKPLLVNCRNWPKSSKSTLYRTKFSPMTIMPSRLSRPSRLQVRDPKLILKNHFDQKCSITHQQK